MNINIVDVLFHVPADLPQQEREEIARDLQSREGVVSAHFAHDRPHMFEVAYNPESVNVESLRQVLTARGLAVSMVGM